MKTRKLLLWMVALTPIGLGTGMGLGYFGVSLPSISSLTLVLDFIGRLDSLIGVGTLVVVLVTACQIGAAARIGEESVKVFFHTMTSPDCRGKAHCFLTRIRKLGQGNFRFTRRELTPLFLVQWLKEAFVELKHADLGFILTEPENLERFRGLVESGSELHLYCADRETFAQLFTAFHPDVEDVGSRIREVLEKGLPQTATGSEIELPSITCTQRSLVDVD